MRRSSLAALVGAAACAALASTPAGATELGHGFSVSGEAALVSDYRFRGISLSGGRPAGQGGLTLEHESGFYGAMWSSTIAESEGGADIELDLVAGFATELPGAVGIDLSVSRYTYPSDSALSYTEATATLSRAFGAATPRIGVAYAPAQRAMRDEFGARHDNVYLFTGLEFAMPDVPVTLNAEIGYERGWFDVAESGGKVDWRLGGTLAVRGFDLGLHYSDSDASLMDRRGRDLGGATVVASLTFTF